jgi:hypothetical protein
VKGVSELPPLKPRYKDYLLVLGDVERLTGETSGKIAFLSSEDSKIYLSKGGSGVSLSKIENSSGEVKNHVLFLVVHVFE